MTRIFHILVLIGVEQILKCNLGGGGGEIGSVCETHDCKFSMPKKQKPWHPPQTSVVDRFYGNSTMQVVQAADKFSGHQPELTPQAVMQQAFVLQVVCCHTAGLTGPQFWFTSYKFGERGGGALCMYYLSAQVSLKYHRLTLYQKYMLRCSVLNPLALLTSWKVCHCLCRSQSDGRGRDGEDDGQVCQAAGSPEPEAENPVHQQAQGRVHAV